MCVVFLVNVDNLILMVSDCLNGKALDWSGLFFPVFFPFAQKIKQIKTHKYSFYL